jgi:hypothetical protein
MIDKYILILCVTWYCYNNGLPSIFLNIIKYILNNYDNFFTLYNTIIYGDYYEYNDDDDKDVNDDNTLQNKEMNKNEIKEVKKYEDKYLNEIRKLSKEWLFTEDEQIEMSNIIKEFFDANKEEIINKMKEIDEEIVSLQEENSEDYVVDSFSYDEDNSMDNLRREKMKELTEAYKTLQLQIETEEGIEKLKQISEKKGIEHIINKRLDKLENCYVIEKTPIGNVLMIYDKNKEAFKYYSDCNIPYRYLEVVGRKYIKTFNCRPIYIDMEEELKLFEERWEKEQLFKKMRKEEEKRIDFEQINPEKNKKKNVFAKFKSYNKDSGGKMSMAPPKNSIPNIHIDEKKENEKIILKEKANRYTYEGKFVNFNFLKKIERKVFNKKLGLSFSDFKKIIN